MHETVVQSAIQMGIPGFHAKSWHLLEDKSGIDPSIQMAQWDKWHFDAKDNIGKSESKCRLVVQGVEFV